MKLKYLLMIALAAMLAACGNNDEPEPPEEDLTDRTVLVYMTANCDLGVNGWAMADLREMMSAVANGALDGGGRLLVYHDIPNNGDTRLVELLPDSTERVVKTYDGTMTATDAARMREVMADARAEAPSASYGLVLWGHGTGWLEESSSRSDGPLRSFGNDGGRRMKITTLAGVLNDFPSDWIYFDCCHMGTVEVAYELRKAATFIVASTPELPLEGMPYDKNVPLFFKRDAADLEGAAHNTYSYYMDDPRASCNYCTISLVDTRKLDALADATRAILSTGPALPDTYTPRGYARRSIAGTIYDMGDYMMALETTDGLKTAWNQAYKEAVPYHVTTPWCYGFDMSHFTGLGCHIVETSADIAR